MGLNFSQNTDLRELWGSKKTNGIAAVGARPSHSDARPCSQARGYARSDARPCVRPCVSAMRTVDRACWHGRALSQAARFLVKFSAVFIEEEHSFHLLLVILERELGEQ